MPDGVTTAPATGVIHDIGYRGYTGPRLGRWYLVRSLYSQSLRGAYGLGRPIKSKIMPMALMATMLFPALIMVVVAIITGLDELPVRYTEYIPITFYLTAIFLASQAPQLVSLDLRFRVVPLYMSRPLTYRDYVLAKYAAMSSALLVLTGLPILILYVGALLAKMPFWAQTRGLAMGLIGAVLFSLVLAGVGLAIASATPRRGFGVAAIITVILVSYTVVSAVQGVSIETGHPTIAVYAELFSPFNLVNSFQLWLFDIPQNPMFSELRAPRGWQGVLFGACVLAVIGASFGALMLRYRKASAR
jgi:ABC-2 type transport system permease protein